MKSQQKNNYKIFEFFFDGFKQHSQIELLYLKEKLITKLSL